MVLGCCHQHCGRRCWILSPTLCSACYPFHLRRRWRSMPTPSPRARTSVHRKSSLLWSASPRLYESSTEFLRHSLSVTRFAQAPGPCPAIASICSTAPILRDCSMAISIHIPRCNLQLPSDLPPYAKTVPPARTAGTRRQTLLTSLCDSIDAISFTGSVLAVVFTVGPATHRGDGAAFPPLSRAPSFTWQSETLALFSSSGVVSITGDPFPLV